MKYYTIKFCFMLNRTKIVDCNHTFPIDFPPNGIPLGSKSIEKNPNLVCNFVKAIKKTQSPLYCFFQMTN